MITLEALLTIAKRDAIRDGNPHGYALGYKNGIFDAKLSADHRHEHAIKNLADWLAYRYGGDAWEDRARQILEEP